MREIAAGRVRVNHYGPLQIDLRVNHYGPLRVDLVHPRATPQCRGRCRAVSQRAAVQLCSTRLIRYVRRVDPSADTLRVVLADDHHFFREGLRGMLESAGVSVVGEARDGSEVVALAGELKPDVIVIDLNMAKASGADALRRIAAVSPEARTVVLTASVEEDDVIEALQAGACGYILKDTRAEDLIDGIRQTSGSQVVLSKELIHKLVRGASANNHAVEQSALLADRPVLTSREKDVLRLIAAGADNITIGLELSISRHTVKQHVTNIFEKLGVRTRVEAAVYAVRAGLV
jgi:two-component system nitrate/nitrite response regulator NarL